MEDADRLCHTRKLRSLLAVRSRDLSMFASASTDALLEAEAIGPELATFAVSTMLHSYDEGRDPATHERAADLAFRLHLVGAVPALVGCLERLSEFDSVAHAALRTLESMREEATPPLLDAFGRCTSRDDRLRLASALARVGARGERVRDAYLSVLADHPRNGAGFLAEHGDRDALPHLLATFDRLELGAADAHELDRLESIVAVGQAIRTLRGSFSRAHREKFEHAWSRSEDLLLQCPPVHEPGPRPGRNDPCPCGSGQKYKRCCLDSDENDPRH
jgi:hypothetical protein